MHLWKAATGKLQAYVDSKYAPKSFDRPVAIVRNNLKCSEVAIEEINPTIKHLQDISRGLAVIIVREDI